MFVLAIITVVCVASQAPGIKPELFGSNVLFPTVFGYEKIFHINEKQATFISIIPICISTFVYLHIVARQIKSMVTSGLLPSFLKNTYGEDQIPIIALSFVGFLAFLANLYTWGLGIEMIALSRVSTLASCFVYVSMFYCYIIFNKKYGHLERGFHNPFGIYSAIPGFLFFLGVFFLTFFANIDIYWNASLVYFVLMVSMLIYYYTYAESRQCFSASEQKVFFKAYIVNMQIRKKKAMHRRFASDIVGLFSMNLLKTVRSIDRQPTSDNNSNNSDNQSSIQNSSNHMDPKIKKSSSRTFTSTSSNSFGIFGLFPRKYRVIPSSSPSKTIISTENNNNNITEGIGEDKELYQKVIIPLNPTEENEEYQQRNNDNEELNHSIVIIS